jgi:FAD/FMN-containing dehydrogenase
LLTAPQVRIANKCSIPFLAYNGVHGAITTLGRMDWGIAINLNKLSSVAVASNGETATIAGGTNSKVVIDALWAADKQTVTGTCECVSFLGPALGGGHGWLQGHYGLISDQFVSMKVVVADGTLKTVSATSNSDLWWAMKGAGHNFGIVTSVTVKVYPRVHTTWAIETFMFAGDKVEALYQAANDHLLQDGAQPVDIINWSYWMNIPEVDPTGPVIEFYIIQEGVTVVDPAYTEPFHALGPISATPNTGSYLDVSAWVGIALDGPPCQKTGAANPRFPLYLPAYNPAAMQELYAHFKTSTNASSPFATSLFMFEGYSMQAVHAIDTASTAYAFRDDELLTAPLVQYTPAGPARDLEAKQLGNELREILHRGTGRSEMHTYVNYAYGDESPEEWYGHEQWRQDRLKALKGKYDPQGRFSFYAPAA